MAGKKTICDGAYRLSADGHDELPARCNRWHLEMVNFGPSRPNMYQVGKSAVGVLESRLGGLYAGLVVGVLDLLSLL
jgi:hypothetical protein